MTIRHLIATLLLLSGAATLAQDAEPGAGEKAEAADEAADAPTETVAASGTAPGQPRSMSGMSILGNEEAPKSLVIIPWKSSELGDEIGMSENLDDQAVPVDKDVFMRKLRFYEIRKSE